MNITGGCDCDNIKITWHLTERALTPRACQCDYCASKSAAYVTQSDTKFDVVIRSEQSHKPVQHGSKNAVFHECAHCEQIIFVTAEINGKLYGALNVNHLNNPRGFSRRVEVDFSAQTAVQKRERWRQSWCQVTLITSC